MWHHSFLALAVSHYIYIYIKSTQRSERGGRERNKGGRKKWVHLLPSQKHPSTNSPSRFVFSSLSIRLISFFGGIFWFFFFFFHFIFGDFEQDSKGKDVNLDCYKGKVLLVVNVASKWWGGPSFLLLFFHFLCLSEFCRLILWLIVWNSGFTNSNYTQLTELYSKYKDKSQLSLSLFLSIWLIKICVLLWCFGYEACDCAACMFC